MERQEIQDLANDTGLLPSQVILLPRWLIKLAKFEHSTRVSIHRQWVTKTHGIRRYYNDISTEILANGYKHWWMDGPHSPQRHLKSAISRISAMGWKLWMIATVLIVVLWATGTARTAIERTGSLKSAKQSWTQILNDLPTPPLVLYSGAVRDPCAHIDIPGLLNKNPNVLFRVQELWNSSHALCKMHNLVAITPKHFGARECAVYIATHEGGLFILNPELGKEQAKILEEPMESSTLFPNNDPVRVRRPVWISIDGYIAAVPLRFEYVIQTTQVVTDVFAYAASSAIDILNGKTCYEIHAEQLNEPVPTDAMLQSHSPKLGKVRGAWWPF